MPVVISGTTYYPFDANVIQDENGQPVPGAVGQVYALGDLALATPLTIKEITGAPLANLVASAQSISPQFLAPALEVVVNFGSVPMERASTDVPNLAQDAAAAAVSAASSATAAANSAAAAAASAALRKTSVLTQAAYDALTPKLTDTIYFIVG